MSRTFKIGRRRWLYVSIDASNTFRGSAFGHRYNDGNHFLWFGSLHLMYTPDFSLDDGGCEAA